MATKYMPGPDYPTNNAMCPTPGPVVIIDRGGRVDSAKDVRNNTFILGLDMRKLVVWTYDAILLVNSVPSITTGYHNRAPIKPTYALTQRPHNTAFLNETHLQQ